jgi:hypothetical protein
VLVGLKMFDTNHLQQFGLKGVRISTQKYTFRAEGGVVSHKLKAKLNVGGMVGQVTAVGGRKPAGSVSTGPNRARGGRPHGHKDSVTSDIQEKIFYAVQG